MERVTHRRAHFVVIILAVLLTFFAFQLYNLQIFQTGGVVDNTTTYTTKTRVKATRGDILDRNGNVLVGNRASYDLVINHYVLTSSDTPNESLLQLVELCQKLGIEYTDHFPITQARPFTYTLDQYNSTWQKYFQIFLRQRGELDSDISAPLLIQALRKSYLIPEEWTDEQARLVIGIRYELTLRNHTNLSNFVFIADAEDEDLSAILELHVPGLNVEASTVREYYTDYAAHIIGFVGSMDKDQWEHYKTIDGYEMDAEVGQSGLEKAFEEYLHGVDGVRVDEVTKDGTVIRSYYDKVPQSGNNVELTIDINLQMAAEDQLAVTIEELKTNEDEEAPGKDVEGGAVIAMEVGTGDILACASYPTYDLSTYFEDYNSILEAEGNPLYNRALQAAYPPGSTYKVSMVIAGINSHTIDSKYPIVDRGVYRKYDNFSPKCLTYTRTGGTHGSINASEALCVSCNYFFYELGDMIPLSAMDDTAKALGLGEPTGIELAEITGYRANKTTKKLLHPEGDQSGWYAADQVLAAIGQSDNQFTPMQLCVYASTLATRGTRYRATFLNRVVSTDYRSLVLENKPEILSTLEISDDAYLAYAQGMRMAVTEYGGTANKIFGNYPIEVSAKTGTAQTGIRNTSDNGAFICYAPSSQPQIAVSVYGEKAGGGSTMGPVAKAIFDIYFEVGEIGHVNVYENQMS